MDTRRRRNGCLRDVVADALDDQVYERVSL